MAKEVTHKHWTFTHNRRKKLIKLFKNKRLSEFRYLQALKPSSKTIKELSDFFNVTYRASNEVLKYLQKFDPIKQKVKFVDRGRRNYKTRYFNLSGKGKALLRELNGL